MRIVVCLLSALGIFLFVSVLFNLPEWHRHEGLPLFPALLMGEAMVLGSALCIYALYAILLKPALGRCKLATQRSSRALPWAHNPQWVRKRVTHSNSGVVAFLWFFAVNWWGALWFFATDRADEISSASVPELLLCAALVLIGLFTVRTAAIKTFEWLRYGRSVLVIETLPGRPGHTFMGRIETGLARKPGQPIELTLTGFTRHWSQQATIPNEESRRVHDVRSSAPFHETSQKIAPSQLREKDGRVVIPFRFAIPRDVPSSGLVDGDMEVVWKVSARTTGRKDRVYTSHFEIPIYNS